MAGGLGPPPAIPGVAWPAADDRPSAGRWRRPSPPFPSFFFFFSSSSSPATATVAVPRPASGGRPDPTFLSLTLPEGDEVRRRPARVEGAAARWRGGDSGTVERGDSFPVFIGARGGPSLPCARVKRGSRRAPLFHRRKPAFRRVLHPGGAALKRKTGVHNLITEQAERKTRTVLEPMELKKKKKKESMHRKDCEEYSSSSLNFPKKREISLRDGERVRHEIIIRIRSEMRERREKRRKRREENSDRLSRYATGQG